MGSTTHTHTDRTPHRSARECLAHSKESARPTRRQQVSQESPRPLQVAVRGPRASAAMSPRPIRAPDCNASQFEIGKCRCFSKPFDRFHRTSGRIRLVRKILHPAAHAPKHHRGECQKPLKPEQEMERRAGATIIVSPLDSFSPTKRVKGYPRPRGNVRRFHGG